MKTFPMKWAGLLMAALLLVSACSETGKGKRAVAKFELFDLVPADTPYVAASSRSLPEELSRRMLKAASLNDRGEEIRIALEGLDPMDEERRRLLELAEALNAELEGKLTPEGLASLGFPLNGRSLIYGLGILPVTWIEITEPARVEAFLDRVEARANVHSQRLTLGETAYRRIVFGDLVGVLSVGERYLVAALLPRSGEQELLALALGERRPESSLADTGGFKEFTGSHGYLGYGDGYIDLVRLVEMALGEASGVNARVLEALGAETESVSPACRRLAEYLVQSAPRISFGFTEAKRDRYTMQGMLETSPEVAVWLQQMAAPVPGLGRYSDVMFGLGLGLNIPVVRDGLKAMLNAVLEHGEGCEEVDQEQLAQTMQTLDLMLSPMFAGIKGFNLVVREARMEPADTEVESVDARLVLAATDPRGMFGMLAMLNPQLATLQIPPDGTPVQVPLQQMAPDAPPTWVAIKGQALGLFLGDQPPADVLEALSAPPDSSALLFALSYNVKKLLEEVGPSLERGMQSLEEQEARDAREIYEAIRQTASLYDRLSFRILGSAEGLVFSGRIFFSEVEEKQE